MDDLTRLAAMIDDLSRRIAALETAPRAPYTTVRAGTITFRGADAQHAGLVIAGSTTIKDAGIYGYTNDDLIRGYIGIVDDGADFAIFVDNPDKSGQVLNVTSLDGMLGPYGTGPWTKNPSQPINSLGNTETTSGSYEVGWRSLMYVTSPQCALEYFVDLGGATTAQVKLTAAVYHDNRSTGAPAAAQTVWTRTVSATSAYTDDAAIPNAIWSPAANPIGSFVQLELSARVASGAGTVSWAPILPAQLK